MDLLLQVIALNKPFDVLTSFTDPEGRPTLADYVPVLDVYAAGRLDMDSEGLLLLTDDGRLAHQLTDPQHKITKTYLVQVEGDVSAQALAVLQRGVEVKGRMTRRCRAVLVPEPNLPERSKPITPHGPTAWIRLELNEGMKRQIRHMTAVVGLPTLRLVRIAIGPVTLAGLAPGEWRRLTAEEISRLRQAAAGTHPGQYNKTKTNSPRSRGK